MNSLQKPSSLDLSIEWIHRDRLVSQIGSNPCKEGVKTNKGSPSSIYNLRWVCYSDSNAQTCSLERPKIYLLFISVESESQDVFSRMVQTFGFVNQTSRKRSDLFVRFIRRSKILRRVDHTRTSTIDIDQSSKAKLLSMAR